MTRLVGLALLLSTCSVTSYTEPTGPRFAGRGAAAEDPEPELRVVTFNVQYARHVDRAIARIQEDPELRYADVILLQEMTPDATERIADALGYHWVDYPASRRGDIELGVGLVSRWPIEEDHKIVLPHRSPFFGRRRVAVGATLRTPDGPLAVYSVHAEMRTMSVQGRVDQLSAVLEDVARRHEESGAPVVIGGDFNTPETWGAEQMRERFQVLGFEHATRSLTATADYVYGSVVLDYLFVRDLEVLDVGAEPTDASDHRPTWALLRRRPGI